MNIKLHWILKRKQKYLSKVNGAFSIIKYEIVDYLKTYDGKITAFIKYLAQTLDTTDIMSFLKMIDGVIETAKNCKGDPEAISAKRLCQYILLKFNILSHFTMQWCTITIKCKKCGKKSKYNLLFTDKLCPYCGNIVIKD